MTATLPIVAPLGLEGERYLWVLIDGESTPLVVTEHGTGTSWVPAALSEDELHAAIGTLDPMPEWKPNTWWMGKTTAETLLRDLSSRSDHAVAGFIVLDASGGEIRRERVR